jgi:2-oxoglutarate dehydrogenase E2 component (dihydrolipoamide succinyltransferase)
VKQEANPEEVAELTKTVDAAKESVATPSDFLVLTNSFLLW